MNKEKLGTLLLECERQLYSTAKTILWNEADIEDAVQDTVAKAFANIHTLSKDKYARTWLIRILINCCYDQLRSSRHMISLEGTAEAQSIPAAASEDYSDLYQAISELPEEQKLPVILYYIDGFSVRETAQILEISEGAVQKRLARARGNLKQRLMLMEVV